MKGAHITKQLLFILSCSGSLFLQTQDTQHLTITSGDLQTTRSIIQLKRPRGHVSEK